MDAFDRKILALLQTDNLRTIEAVSQEVGLSPSACRRRMAAMRADGTIVADVSIVNRDLLGPSLMVLALVSLDRDTNEAHRSFRKLVNSLPEISHVYLVTGSADYVLTITVADMLAYERFAEATVMAAPDVRRTETLVVMARIKAQTWLPL